jgi:hypothetical protein
MSFTPDETITSRERLRELLPAPQSRALREKAAATINDVARRFIELAPFVVVATKGSDGLMDVAPRGDRAGFVEIYDQTTLILPDRPGNQRLDTFENLLQDVSVGLIFIIPGHTETLRVPGHGRVVRDAAIRARHAVNGREPVLALVVDVAEVFMHCSKAFVRAAIWNPDTWATPRSAPSLAEWVKSTVPVSESIEDMQGIHDADAQNRLY